jgi:hypothetical protein
VKHLKEHIMTYRTSKLQLTVPLRAFAIAASLMVGCLSAWAAQSGTEVRPDLVLRNPFNPAKTVEAWRQLGGSDCSGVRISREWVMASAHCGFNPANGFVYLKDVGTDFEWHLWNYLDKRAAIDPATCSDWGTFGVKVVYNTQGVPDYNDIHVCRLMRPDLLPGPSTYPQLAVLPSFDLDTGKALGALLIGGRRTTTSNFQFGLVNFQGMALADRSGNILRDALTGELGLQAATVDREMLQPHVVNGDSGGGAFWLPPDGKDAALVGVISRIKSSVAGFPTVPWFFTDDNLTALIKHMESHKQPGDQIPVIRLSTDPYYKVPDNSRPPAMMQAAPTVSSTGSYETLAAKWVVPSSTVAINRFKLSLRQNGILTTWTVPASASSETLTELTMAPNSRFCVTPVNDISGEAVSVYAKQTSSEFVPVKPVIPGCVDFNNLPPKAVTNLATVVSTRLSSLVTLKSTWRAQDAITTSYRIDQTMQYPGGPKRSVVRELLASSVLTTVQSGTTVCTKVYARTRLGVVSNPAGGTCVVAK